MNNEELSNKKELNYLNDNLLKEIIENFKFWYKHLIKKLHIIIIVSLIGSLVGFFYAYTQKPLYIATLTFALDEDKSSGGSGISSALGLASSLGFDLGSSGGGAFAASNLGELMKSRNLVEKALLKPISIDQKSQTLANYYIEINNMQNVFGRDLNGKYFDFIIDEKRENFSLKKDSILKLIYKKIVKQNLSITQKDKKVTILSLEVISNNELFSKFFCENLAMVVSDFYIKTKSKKARNNVEILEKQTDSIRNQINISMFNAASEGDKVYNLNPSLNSRGIISRRNMIDVQANTKILENLVIQLELAKITLRKETPLIQIIDRPNLPLEKEKLSKLMSLIIGFIVTNFIIIFYFVIKQIISENS